MRLMSTVAPLQAKTPLLEIQTMKALPLVIAFSSLLSTAAIAGTNVPDGGRMGDMDSVNGGFTIGDNAEVGNVDTVNGGIRVGKNSRVGKIDAVNGGISLGDGSSAINVDTVNGGFKGGENVKIERSIDSVNGGISLNNGSTIGEDIDNVNGKIYLNGVQVGGNIETVNGPIELTGATKVNGKLTIKKPGGWCFFDCDDRKPTVIIGANVEIVGGIVLEREVDLQLDPAAKVGNIEHKYKN